MKEVPLVSYLGDGVRRVVGVAHVNEQTGFVEGIIKDSDFARQHGLDRLGEVSFGCFDRQEYSEPPIGQGEASSEEPIVFTASYPVGSTEGGEQVQQTEVQLD
jgi:hypothetical protein